ncbi:MAG: type secretion system protein GspD [Pseudomonadota bacterium]|jgi:general secretion pathway protein D
MKKSWMIFALLVVAANGRAQFEDNEFPPPPPPPPTGFGEEPNTLSSRPTPMGSSSSAGKSGSLISKDKRDKLAQASVDEINDKNYPELIDSFDYNNAEISDVIKAISELTGKNFIIDPGVRGKITIIAPTKITVAEAYKAFLSALAINGYTVVPSGGFFKIKSSRNAQRDNIETYAGNYFPNSDQMITRIIHLKHISADQVSRELRILNSKDGEVTPFNSTNSIILSDYGSNVERVMKIINQLDVPGFEEKLFVLRIGNAKAKDIAELINKIVNKDSSSKGGSGGGSFSAGVPRFGGNAGRSAQGQSGSAYFMVIPDDRTNSLIIVGNTQGIERVKKLVSQLDFKIKADDNGGVYVYYVKNGEAEKIAQTLSGIAKDSKPAGGGGGGAGGFVPPSQQAQSIFGGDVRVTADKDTNSLIITASKQDYEVVLNLLSKIDIQRDQVYVEAVIMEMLIDDAANWGLGYYKFDKESGGMGRVGFNGNINLADVMNPIAGSGAILSFGSGDVFELKTPTGVTQKVTSLVGFLNFLKTTGRTNVLSTPQIMALDNEESEIEVGEEVATSLQTTQSPTGTQTSANFKDATIKLKIKPFISPASDTIRMKIDQKIAQPEAQGQIPNTLTLSKRSITTNIVVPDGDTAVLGGLVKDTETEAITKVPLLGDIPVLGWLFKSRKIAKKKTNLLVFLTPKIIRNLSENQKLVDKKLNERLNFIKQNGGRDPYGKKVDELPRRGRVASSPVKESEIMAPPSAEPEIPAIEAVEEREETMTPEELDGTVVE